MLQFHRESVRTPRLVVVEGGRSEMDGRRDDLRQAGRALLRPPAVLVLLATLVAVVVDLVDSVPAWSHWAVLGTAIVLVTHAVVVRRRAH